MTTLEKLTKALELLDKAYQRKTGYEKWDSSAIWFDTKEQRDNIKRINRTIERLRQYCRDKCINLLTKI